MRRPDIRIRRACDPPEPGDGDRVLVDRLWPRGLKEQEAHLALWLKEIAPTDELRKWFGHEPARWLEFKRRYRAELAHNQTAVGRMRALLAKGPVTLVYGARDAEHNNVVVLAEYLRQVS